MAAIQFSENYLVTKKIYGRTTLHRKDRLDVDPPSSWQELTYQALLSEAHQSFFNREYPIALERYLDLRYRILVQSHPEMPVLPGGGWKLGVDVSKIAFEPLVELSRKYMEKVNPVDPVVLPLTYKHLVQVGEFTKNPALIQFQNIGVDSGLKPGRVTTQLDKGRELIFLGNFDQGLRQYSTLKNEALAQGDVQLAAQVVAEAGALVAARATGNDRVKWLGKAKEQLDASLELYQKTGDQNAQKVVQANLYNLQLDLGNPKDAALAYAGIVGKEIFLNPATGAKLHLGEFQLSASGSEVKKRGAAQPFLGANTTGYYLPGSNNNWVTLAEMTEKEVFSPVKNAAVGLVGYQEVSTIPLERDKYEVQIRNIYTARMEATILEGLDFYEDVETNFVAYIPHLFFFILPIAIGDTYLAMGLFGDAEREYREATKYTFLNHGIEAPYLWLKLADTYQHWGDELFRQERPAQAKIQYEKILTTDLAVPASPLYQGRLSGVAAQVTEAIKEIRQEAHAPVNYKISLLCMKVYQQLQKIQNGLNFLGLSDDYFPIFRYKYLQAVAAYMADQAIQTERTFINFRTAAEQQKFERIQLQNNLELQQSALSIEQKRMEDANLEVQYAAQAHDYAELRRSHAQDTLNDWNTIGWELASVNAALAWASNAANDQKINYTGVRYHGERHDYSGDVEDFYDVVGEVREQLNWELQRNRLDRQVAESAAEVNLAATREQQAIVRRQVQAMTVEMASKRLEGAQELLDYARDKMFDEEMWFRLAGELQDLSRDYLDMAIYSAFLMERAYEIEFDRSLNRIRLDYGIGGVDGLLGGDYLKRDIDSFTLDYLQHAQKKNPVRLVISLQEQFPAAYEQFQRTGVLAFRTDLEIFDRLFPGTCRRKIKKIELFVEGLVPMEGATGFLSHLGISTEWKRVGDTWSKSNRVTPVEQMVLSSYQFRRDLSVFQPSEQMLGLFENLAPQGNWTLEIPRSANNLDYNAINDIKFAVYFDTDFDAGLRIFLSSFYPNTGGKSVMLSSRFHFPDQYFRLDAEKSVSFELGDGRFAFHHTGLAIAGFGVRILDKNGAPVAGQALTIRRESDLSEVAASTDVNGLVNGDETTLAPFAAWKGASPVDTFTVRFPPETITTALGDVQLYLNYSFTYRADG
ncbi:MAG: hypothetical protein ABIQ93_10245, partial [Saprospiraceae bacterium]